MCFLKKAAFEFEKNISTTHLFLFSSQTCFYILKIFFEINLFYFKVENRKSKRLETGLNDNYFEIIKNSQKP